MLGRDHLSPIRKNIQDRNGGGLRSRVATVASMGSLAPVATHGRTVSQDNERLFSFWIGNEQLLTLTGAHTCETVILNGRCAKP